MIEGLNNHITLFERSYSSLNESLAEVSIANQNITVPEHPFWKKFANGWEPDTERIYQSVVKPGSTVLDIGAWIGPTLLFALACGAGKIIALEPNPKSYLAIKKMLDLNPQIAAKITLLDQAISNKPGVSKMGLVEGESDTSTFGIQGDEVEIQTTTISNLFGRHGLDKIDLIKIDIEGAEGLLADEIAMLSQRSGQKIHLSLHLPLFPKTIDKNRLAEAFQGFDIYDDRGEQLNYQALKVRLTSDEPFPPWGSKHGNYFEVFLIAQ